MKTKTMPKFIVKITNKDGSQHITEGWGVINKVDADMIITAELGLDRAQSVMVSNGKKCWMRVK